MTAIGAANRSRRGLRAPAGAPADRFPDAATDVSRGPLRRVRDAVAHVGRARPPAIVSAAETLRRPSIGDTDRDDRNYSLSVLFRLVKNARSHQRRQDRTPPVACRRASRMPAPHALRRFAPDDGTRLLRRAHDNRYKLDTRRSHQ